MSVMVALPLTKTLKAPLKISKTDTPKKDLLQALSPSPTLTNNPSPMITMTPLPATPQGTLIDPMLDNARMALATNTQVSKPTAKALPQRMTSSAITFTLIIGGYDLSDEEGMPAALVHTCAALLELPDR